MARAVNFTVTKQYVVIAKNHDLGSTREGTKWTLNNYELLFESDDKMRVFQYYHSQPFQAPRDLVVGVKDEERPFGYRGLNKEELDELWSY